MDIPALVNNSIISQKDLVNETITGLLPFLKPIIGILLSLAGLYVAYLIIRIIFIYLNARRIKRIDKNVQQILNILEPKEKKKRSR